MSKYFAYGPVFGFELFDTEQEAKDFCEKEIETCLSYDWSEDVGSVCWGKVCEVVTQTDADNHCRYRLEEPR